MNPKGTGGRRPHRIQGRKARLNEALEVENTRYRREIVELTEEYEKKKGQLEYEHLEAVRRIREDNSS